MSTVFICGDTVFTSLFQQLEQQLRARGINVLRGPANSPGHLRHYTAAETPALVADAQVAVLAGRHIWSREVLEALPKTLHGVCFPAIGVEALDLQAASELGIVVGNGPTQGNVVGMAEATIMLMLALLYDLHGSQRRLAEQGPRLAYPQAQALCKKTVGLIGFGRIARATASRLHAFGVRILTYSPRAHDLPDYVEAVDLPTLLQNSDIVVVLVSITPESRGLLGAQELALMKKSAFLINVARGEAIDETALYQCLRDKAIAGAALDTFVVEPLPLNSPLRSLDNVILTPHMVGQTRESADEMLPTMLDNILRMLDQNLPLHCKNPEVERSWLRRQSHVAHPNP